VPQIVVDFSANLAGAFDARGFALKLHDALVEIAGANIESCKTRLVRRDDMVIASGELERGMMHADIRILPGRNAEQKSRLGEVALELLGGSLSKPQGFHVQLSVEVGELDRDNYHKRVLAP
jgi:5-carboxymethyl-2-hydroxymuconate isomerase